MIYPVSLETPRRREPRASFLDIKNPAPDRGRILGIFPEI
jgi:hypothetical protein